MDLASQLARDILEELVAAGGAEVDAEVVRNR